MTITIVASVGAAIGFLVLGWVIWSLEKDVRVLRHEVSRFEMYAVRDQLVSLVARGIVAEDDPAWQQGYRNVNRLLGLHQSVTVGSFVQSLSQHFRLMEHDDLYRQRYLQSAELLTQKMDDCPEFAEVVRAVGPALVFMLALRSNSISIQLTRWRLVAMAFLAGGAGSARRISTGLHNPEELTQTVGLGSVAPMAA